VRACHPLFCRHAWCRSHVIALCPSRCHPEGNEGSVPSPNQAIPALSAVEGAQHDKTVEHISLLVFLWQAELGTASGEASRTSQALHGLQQHSSVQK
jgi:hypothetical protein